MENNQTIGVGGLVRYKNSILMVKHSYGITKGKWDFPRGYVNQGEALEDAIVREMKEEANVIVKPLKIIALREMTKSTAYSEEDNLLIIWLLEYVEGEPAPDKYEILDVKFMTDSDIINSVEIDDLTKELVKIAIQDKGLTENSTISIVNDLWTTHWKMYSI